MPLTHTAVPCRLFVSGSHKAAYPPPKSIATADSPLWSRYSCPPGSLIVFAEATCQSQRAAVMGTLDRTPNRIPCGSEKFAGGMSETLFDSFGEIFRGANAPVDPPPGGSIVVLAVFVFVDQRIAAQAKGEPAVLTIATGQVARVQLASHRIQRQMPVEGIDRGLNAIFLMDAGGNLLCALMAFLCLAKPERLGEFFGIQFGKGDRLGPGTRPRDA